MRNSKNCSNKTGQLLLLLVLGVRVAACLSIGINDDDTRLLDDESGLLDDETHGLRHYALETPAAVKQIVPNYHGDTVSVTGQNDDRVRSGGSLIDGSAELKRARRSKQNLCEHLCTCDLEAKFVTVNCSFLMDKVRS